MTQHESIRPDAGRDPGEEGTSVRRRSEHDEVVTAGQGAAEHGAARPSQRPSRSPGSLPPPAPAPSRQPPQSGSMPAVEAGARISRNPPASALLSGQRLDERVEHAQRLLLTLAPNDRRRRLLHAAILRRDEMLLEGFIKELEG